MTDPITRVIAAVPAAFFRSLTEQVDAAFGKALWLTRQYHAEPEQANMLGQARHACCEEGFRLAAEDAGIAAVAPHTVPAGGRYSLISHESVHLIRGNVQVHCGPPRPTRFRSAWAALNAWLRPAPARSPASGTSISIGSAVWDDEWLRRTGAMAIRASRPSSGLGFAQRLVGMGAS